MLIKRKLKTCSICDEQCYLFSKGCCKSCWQKIYGKSSIKRTSDKMKERTSQYQWLRDKYLKDHPTCEICGTKKDLDLHHKKFRDGDNLFSNFMTVCRNCHNYIHENVLESYQKGWLLSRLEKWKENDKEEEDNDLTNI